VEAMGKYMQHMKQLSIGEIFEEVALGHEHGPH
jgi:hypothetical protein